jgi:ABC-2 type transport system permease protein
VAIMTIFIYEMKRLSRSWMTLLFAIIAPVVLIVLLGLALKDAFAIGDRELRQAEVVIYSEDDGIYFDALRQYLESGDVRPYILPVYAESLSHLEERLRIGEAHLGIVIPGDFSLAVLKGEQAEWTLYPGTGLDKNIIAQGLIQVFLERINFAEHKTGQRPSEAEGQLAARERVPVSLDSGEGQVRLDKLETFSMIQYFSVHVLIMSIFYSGLMLAVNLLYDRENHLLERLKVLPVKPFQVVLGKMLAFLVLSGLQSAIVIGLSASVFDVDWGDRPFVLALTCLLTMLIAMSLAFLVTLIVKSVGGVAAIFNTIVLISTFAAGSFYPSPGGWLEKFAKFTLNEWASSVMFSLMLRSGDAIVWKQTGVLFAAGALILLIAFSRFRSSFFRKE